eukprot:CAMPEP_0197238912 /NCGR_PEP_ID=MMETSP1429-20130617/5425_1 /TAXON_ID=49237 /ORGANISM="Chaetoceros  sp., Strain UNC1202" /LENGTH=119 /DNA_ID=CAMNT_0042698199 /DNA_START=172 /DNA_END=531 /DNA_ORIENTATION=-
MTNGGFDFGMVSFAGSAISSLHLVRITKTTAEEYESPGKCVRTLAFVTHLTVAFNYAFGAFIACTIGESVYKAFAYYCIIFMVLWLGVAIKGWELITNTLNIGVAEDWNDVDVLYDFGD